MKYRNIIRNADGTYNIVWFGSAGKTINNIEVFISFKPKYEASSGDSGIVSFTKEEIIAGTTKEITLIDGVFDTQLHVVHYYRGKYTIVVHDGLISVTCENLSDMVSGTRRAIITDGLTVSDGYTKVIFIDNTNTKSGDFSLNGKLPYTKIPADNYVEKQEGIAKSLTQWLAVIKGELWYSINTGLPLLDKIRNKAVFDAYIIKTINSHPEVTKLIKFTSSVNKNDYAANCIILSIYGEEFSFSFESVI